MPGFSAKSKWNLNSCHPDLQRVFNEVIKHVDCSIIDGHRGKAEQNQAFAEKKSQKKFPDSTHNVVPSLAVDAVRHPIDWKDIKGHYFFAGFVIGIAKSMGIELRCGGDWDRDWDVNDQDFYDLFHFELVNAPGKSA
jgi:hypothetical protein